MKQLANVAVLLAVAAYNTHALGQQASQVVSASSVEPTMVSLANASYPPLALSARIYGDVVLKLGIRKDGSVASAVAVGGHPMLAKAALDSAWQSRFACTACSEDVTSYLVTYDYQLASEPFAPDWPCSESHQHTTQTAPRNCGRRTPHDSSIFQ